MKYITLFNIDGEIGHPIYHRSNQNIIKPTYEGIDEARSWSKTHHNSVLGLWEVLCLNCAHHSVSITI